MIRRIPRFRIVVDQYNMQILRALRTKLYRDYLTFFRSLLELYGKSKQRREINEAISKIKRSVAFLDSVLIEGELKKGDAEDLAAQLGELNELRDQFLEQVKNVRALSRRVEEVRRETGISLEDLSITKEVVKKGIQQARRPIEKPSVLERLQEVAPRTYRAGARLLKGAGVAAFGPFAPLVDLVFPLATEMFKLPLAAGRALRRRREERFWRSLRPVTGRATLGELEQIQVERRMRPGVLEGRESSFFAPGIGPSIPRPIKRSREEQVAPLMYFFDKKAYRAKWTKELLSRFKRFEKKERGMGIMSSLLSSVGALPGRLLKLSAAIVPLVGKAGLLAGLGASIGFTINRVYKLGEVIASLRDVREQLGAGARKVGETVAQRKEAIREMGLEEYAKRTGRTSTGALVNILALEERARLQKYESLPWYKKIFTKKPELKTTYEIRERLEELKTELGIKGPPPGAAASAAREKQIAEEINKLSGVIKDLSQQVGRDKEVPAIKDASLGNLYDSGDVLINEHASGSLTLEGE